MPETRLRILFVTPNPPSAIRVRPYHFARALAARGHRVTLAAPCAGAREAADVAHLRELGFDVITQPLGRLRRVRNLLVAQRFGVPFQALYAWQPGLVVGLVGAIRQAESEGRPFDLAHVEHLRGAAYALRLKPHLPVVWDSVDSITDLFEQTRDHTRSRRGRLIAGAELEKTREYEGWLVTQFDDVIVTSTSDRATLLQLAETQTPLHVIPNGVDLAHFAPTTDPRDPATILFSGKLSYHANVTAARHLVEDIMPRVWAAQPNARVVLAGADPAREVLRLAEADPQRITVTGTVDDLRPWFHRATVAVAPMVYAVGIQNKILEAMATATPVVASPVSVRAVGASPDRDLLVGADPGGFASAILSLLADPAQAATLGAAGRAYVERCHNWNDAATRLESVYHAAIQSPEAHVSPPPPASPP